MAKNSTAVSEKQISENPLVLIKYDPENALALLATNTTKRLATINGVKAITNPKQLESVSEIINEAQIDSESVETFIVSLREKIQGAAARFREIEGFEDFEVTLTIRKWSLRQLLNDGIGRLKSMRARFLADEQERINREQLAKQAEQDRINREAADKAAKVAKAAGAGKETVAEIKKEVMATPAPIIESKAQNIAQAAGVSMRYQYTAHITSLKSFLGFCLNNPVMLATLAAAIPDIEKAFRKMASDQKEGFKFPGIEYVKTPIDIGRRA
jgi:hypothetical protein